MKKAIFKLLYGLALFFWRRSVRFAKKNNQKPAGIIFQRDPEAPCEFYEPCKRSPNLWKDCETDGHYLCAKCFHNAKNQ